MARLLLLALTFGLLFALASAGTNCASVTSGSQTTCVCYSGYQSSDANHGSSSSGSCSAPTEYATCTGIPSPSATTTIPIGDFSSPTGTFSSNGFSFIINAPLVSSRYFNYLTFGAENTNTCGFPFTNKFVKSIDASTPSSCKDVYTGTFDLATDFTDCKLSKTSSAGGVDSYQGILYAGVTEMVTTSSGNTAARTIASSLTLGVDLPVTVTATPSNLQISVYPPINQDAVVTQQKFTRSSLQVLVEVTTWVGRDFKLTSTTASLPTFTSASNPSYSQPTPTVGASSSCTLASNKCSQTTTVTFSAADICSFSGDYQLNFQVGCADSVSCYIPSGSETSSVSFHLESGNLCSKVLVISHITGVLATQSGGSSYPSDSQIDFKVTLTSDVPVSSVTLNSFTAVSSSGSTDLKLSTHYQTPTLDSAHTDPKNPVYFLSGSISATTVTTYTISATLGITYTTAFSRKRDLQTSSLKLDTVLLVDSSNSPMMGDKLFQAKAGLGNDLVVMGTVFLALAGLVIFRKFIFRSVKAAGF